MSRPAAGQSSATQSRAVQSSAAQNTPDQSKGPASRSLEALVEEFLSARIDAPISECVEYILKKQKDGELNDEDHLWIEKAQRRGLEDAVDHRFRGFRFTHRGLSVRRLATYMDEQGQHRWVDLKRALTDGTDEERAQIIAHARSVIKEAVGMIEAQAKIIVSFGVPIASIETDALRQVRTAFAAIRKEVKRK